MDVRLSYAVVLHVFWYSAELKICGAVLFILKKNTDSSNEGLINT